MENCHQPPTSVEDEDEDEETGGRLPVEVSIFTMAVAVGGFACKKQFGFFLAQR
jgi:hypothetical protein